MVLIKRPLPASNEGTKNIREASKWAKKEKKGGSWAPSTERSLAGREKANVKERKPSPEACPYPPKPRGTPIPTRAISNGCTHTGTLSVSALG